MSIRIPFSIFVLVHKLRTIFELYLCRLSRWIVLTEEKSDSDDDWALIQKL